VAKERLEPDYEFRLPRRAEFVILNEGSMPDLAKAA
jgi:hypothetical protein